MEVDLESVIADMLLEQFNQPVKIVSLFFEFIGKLKSALFQSLSRIVLPEVATLKGAHYLGRDN